jgi:uncharacterized protein (DUF1778 family)
MTLRPYGRWFITQPAREAPRQIWRSAARRASDTYRRGMARTVRVTIRVTPEQRALIAAGAALAGQSISAFLRTAALERADRLIAAETATARRARSFSHGRWRGRKT